METTRRKIQLCTANAEPGANDVGNNNTHFWEYNPVYTASKKILPFSSQRTGEQPLSVCAALLAFAGVRVSVTTDDEMYNAVRLTGFLYYPLNTVYSKNVRLFSESTVWVDLSGDFVLYRCRQISSPRYQRWSIGLFTDWQALNEGRSCHARSWMVDNSSLHDGVSVRDPDCCDTPLRQGLSGLEPTFGHPYLSA